MHSGVLEGEEGNSMVRGGYRPSQWYHECTRMWLLWIDAAQVQMGSKWVSVIHSRLISCHYIRTKHRSRVSQGEAGDMK